MTDTTYELRVIDRDGLWFFVITRNGREIVEVSQPYGPIFPNFAKQDCEEEGKARLAVYRLIQQQLCDEQAALDGNDKSDSE